MANTIAIKGATVDLAVSKAASVPPYYFNDNITFTLTASNLSTTNIATGVTVNDLLPAGYTYVSHSASNGNANYIPGTGVWTIGNLNSNSSAALNITATIDCYESAYNNTATISGNQSDPVSNNNTSSVNITPQTGGPTPCPVYANNDADNTTTGVAVIIDVTANDLWSVNPISLSIISIPSHGNAVVSGDDIIYTPVGGYNGTDQFTYQICDNQTPQQCDQAVVTINITPEYFDICGNAINAKIFYLPFPENETQLRPALESSAASGNPFALSNNARSIISIKVPYPNTIIIYDHWENGYEVNISNPSQSNTVIWGDNDLSNGTAPGYANDIIPAGGSIVLDNTFQYMPRVQSTVVYDGKDKLYTSADVSISKVTGDANTSRFPVQNMKTDISDDSRFGTSFTIGFGENTTSPPAGGTSVFKYMALYARAKENGTIITLDYDGNGSNDVTSPTLNEGEVWFYDGTASNPNGDPDTYPNGDVNNPNDIKQGAIVNSNFPIGVDIVFGGIETTYALRNSFILPSVFYGSTYYCPVFTTLTGGLTLLLFMCIFTINRDLILRLTGLLAPHLHKLQALLTSIITLQMEFT